MELRDVVALVVTLVVALISVSSVVIYKSKKGKVNQKNVKGDNINNEQHIQNGNGNIQAGGNVVVKTKDWK